MAVPLLDNVRRSLNTRARVDLSSLRARLPRELPRPGRGPRGTVGLDLDGNFVAAVQVADGDVVRAVSRDLDPGLITDGEVADIAGLSEILRNFFERTGLPQRVRLGVANQQIVVRHLELPWIEDPAEREAAIRFQAGEAIPMPLDEVVLDYQLVERGSSPDELVRMPVIVVAARESMIMRFVEAVHEAGLRPEGIDLDAFALVRVLAEPSRGDQNPARVFCHLGGVTNLAVARGPTCMFTRPLATAWQGHDPVETGQLAEQIRMSIDFYMTQPGASPVEDVVLSGPASDRHGLPAELSDLLALPVIAAEPLGRLQAASLPPYEDRHRHTIAAGLALGAAA